ncbi:hypothetical protein VTK73DRAFT_2915 [Phialemonium thermophilum]|uniref:Ribosomal protein S35, mitochondrial n=1 Tax=Phialemonium thermophilum TaxID=223376 RepID=A0ABR3X1L5_9PEZI
MPPQMSGRTAGRMLELTPRCPKIHNSCLSAAGRPRRGAQQTNSFSTTCSRNVTKLRRDMAEWMQRVGKQFKGTAGPKYLGPQNQPFPENPYFRSQPVLSEKSKAIIWQKVIVSGQPIKAVSAEFGVDMRRVAAVVRLKEMERAWKAENKPMALPYARAIMRMLPKTDITLGKPHEPINEIHVHSFTTQQLFVPTSESRHFTREDAAKAFGDDILPADKRVPHPELIQLNKDMLKGVPREEAWRRFEESARASENELAERERLKREREERNKIRVDSGRFEFRFESINVDDAGKDGRSRKGTGWRYGVPYSDRKKGQIKIPTKVE